MKVKIKMNENMTLLDALRTRNARTANGALTNSTSLSSCLDYFFVAGLHREDTQSFAKAFAENPDLALKILFWSRDVRGGSGARATFDAVMKELQNEDASLFSKLFKYIPEFGYWKEIFKLKPTAELVDFVVDTLNKEDDHSLCAKYCPRKGWWFSEIRKATGLDQKELRKQLVARTQVVENLMCENRWSEVAYEQVPSVAGLRYRKLFYKHDGERYGSYIESVNKGETKINSSVLYPHNIYEEYLKNRRGSLTKMPELEAMWNGLPNFMEGCKERILPLCDVSGSMTGTPMAISVALGCYISQHNEGIFKDAFMTFESRPQLCYLKGDSIISRFNQLENAEWGGSTDLQAAFDLILRTATKNHIAESEMPTKLLIISDMQFNSATGGNGTYDWTTGRWVYNDSTNYEVIEQKYADAGYKLPEIIFWNVNGPAGDLPVTMRDLGTGLVSGYSPSILTSVLKGEVKTPYQLMLDTVDTERYKEIHV